MSSDVFSFIRHDVSNVKGYALPRSILLIEAAHTLFSAKLYGLPLRGASGAGSEICEHGLLLTMSLIHTVTVAARLNLFP